MNTTLGPQCVPLIMKTQRHRPETDSANHPFPMFNSQFSIAAMKTMPKPTTRSLMLPFLMGLALLASSPAISAATPNPPNLMSYQGYLVDVNGAALAPTAPANYPIIFRIYDASTGGNTLWAEQQIVTVDKGNFSVVLGEGTAVDPDPRPALSSVFGGATASDRFLGITVTISGTTMTISPRLRLLPSPYAFVATAATTLISNSGQTLLTLANGKLEGTSDLTITGNATVSGSATLNSATLNPGPLTVTGNATVSGSVGIGTTSPQKKFHIQTSGQGDFAYTAEGNVNFLQFGNGSFGGTPDVRFTSPNAVFAYLTLKNTGGMPGVGIGTTTPSTMLQVGKGDNAGVGGVLINTGWIDANQAVARPFDVQVRGDSKLIVSGQGNVGIGTGDPSQAKLVVNGAAGTDTIGTHASFVNTGGGGANIGTYNLTDVSIKGSHAIHALFFRAVSDARIKSIQGRSNGAADLGTLNRIEITDYHYKDVVTNGSRPHKKVIGQQVEEVFPQAVTRSTDVVPDIYREAVVRDGWIRLSTELKKGERVRLISDTGNGIYEVLEATPDRFRVKLDLKDQSVFVYGREVKDFRVVDYEAIAMLNVSATQELARQVESLKKSEARIAELEQKTARMAELEAKAARVDSLEREMAELKKLVAGLAPASSGAPVSVARAVPAASVAANQ